MSTRTRIMAVAVAMGVFSGAMAQENEDATIERLPFQKNHFGVTASYTFSVQDIDQPRLILYALPGTHQSLGNYNPGQRLLNGYRTEHDEYGVGVFYTWHPLMRKNKVAWYDGLFLKFDVAGQYTCDHSDLTLSNDENYFMFNVGVSAGYTFTFNKVGIDIFTGLLGRFATKERSYEDSHSYYFPEEHIIKNATREVKCFPGGLTWRSGIGINYSHVGVYLTFNDPLGYFIREHTTDILDGEIVNEETHSLKDRNSMTVGVVYRF